jgi:Predicted glycosyltransferases
MSEVPGNIPWEVIIVDNCSKDNTAEVSVEEWNKHQPKTNGFKVVRELTPGLSAARARGINESLYEYIIFCDDDNWVQPDYIQKAYDIMEARLEVAVLGGWGEPVCEVQPPEWFEDFKTYYATGPQAVQSADVTDTKGYVYGACSIFRRSYLKDLFEIGFVSMLEDRKGNKLTAGGDTELCNALKLAGYRIWYDASLKFKHFIPKERLTWQYIEKMHKGYLQGYSVITAYRYVQKAPNRFLYFWTKDIYDKTVQLGKILYRYRRFLKEGRRYKFNLLVRFKTYTILNVIFNVFKVYGSYRTIGNSAWYRK